jgi:hypothetical protein
MRQAALVTGASSGLGEQLALLAAQHGHDVVLVARNTARLEAVAERIRGHNVAAHVLTADLASAEAPRHIAEVIQQKGISIDFLVNNAGFGTNGAFLDLPLTGEAEMVLVNCGAVVQLTHLLAGPMRERRRGRILNIASTAAFQPGPFMATYYATKAFVVSFSEALSFELKPHGVSVTCFCPGATATEFAARSGNERSRLFKRGGVAKAEDVAQAAWDAMMRGDVLTVHGALNWLVAQSVRLSPRAAVRAIAAALNSEPGPQNR